MWTNQLVQLANRSICAAVFIAVSTARASVVTPESVYVRVIISLVPAARCANEPWTHKMMLRIPTQAGSYYSVAPFKRWRLE